MPPADMRLLISSCSADSVRGRCCLGRQRPTEPLLPATDESSPLPPCSYIRGSFLPCTPSKICVNCTLISMLDLHLARLTAKQKLPWKDIEWKQDVGCFDQMKLLKLSKFVVLPQPKSTHFVTFRHCTKSSCPGTRTFPQLQVWLRTRFQKIWKYVHWQK